LNKYTRYKIRAEHYSPYCGANRIKETAWFRSEKMIPYFIKRLLREIKIIFGRYPLPFKVWVITDRIERDEKEIDSKLYWKTVKEIGDN